MQKSQDKREISRQQDPKGRKTPQSPSPDTAVQAHMWRPQPPQFPEMLGCVPSVQLTLGNRKGTGPGSQADLSPPNSAPLLPRAPCNLSFFISQWKLQLLPAGQLEYIKQYLRKTANTISSQECLLGLNATTECYNFLPNGSSVGQAGRGSVRGLRLHPLLCYQHLCAVAVLRP